MAVKPNKMAVLKALQQADKALGLAELLPILGVGYSERSTRRWLLKMVEEGLVKKTGQKRGTRYQAVLTQDQAVLTHEQFSPEVIKIFAFVRQPLFNRQPVSYNQAWFDSYQPNKSSYLSEPMVRKLYEVGKRSTNKEPAGTYARHIYNRLLIDLSYNSSRLEGNTYSLLDTKRLLLEGESAKGKLNEEKVMILNHKDAIRHLVDNADQIKIDENEICTMHYLLADGLVPTKYAGKIRDHGVRISGSTYIPYENPIQIQQQLKRICKKAALINEPYEQSIFLLIHISYLQAFVDVNKRTARLCSNIPLVRKNFAPLSFNDIEKEDYISSMIAIYELNDVRPLCELYTFSYLRTCQMYDATVEALGFDELRVRYRKQRRDIIRHIIANKLRDEPMKSFIQTEAKKHVVADDVKSFIEDVFEDLNEISPQRIAGIGITKKQLNDWLKKH